ncbi:c-type cytochrome biogenesis protein CcmI [Halomonas lysinitropha]|uniref:Formate-dependent nitrite reductase complex subunit NrfG n=1 Tax=Halomonas lysinitropha TaxID=2607506 RepID=A0A5K1I3B3_9GAMM|nr:c-type cytochrome biogenesis protein CcmI [Halomonas lysinitropha]VVZ95915.1 Formate-dependent nitrite reductase complex subunit NrfG [Halomonas lysinitropha]
MTLLWIALAVLLLPALWLLVAPLRRADSVRAAQRDFEANDRTTEQNLAIYRRRLASLEAAWERGDIDASRFEEDRLELERSLLEDTEHLERGPLKSAASGKLAVPVVMVAVVLASVVWYLQEGAEGDLTLYTVQQEVRNDPEASLPVLVERLEDQADRQPDNPNVWRALFPLYRDSGRTAEATRTLERLIELEGRQPPLLAELAQIRFFAAGREMTDEVQALVDEVLAMDSSQPTVLGMLGINAFDNGDYETAIDRWRRAIAGMDDPNTADALRQGIRVAQQRLGIAPEEAEPAVAEGPGIAVRVRLADDLAGRLDADATVFVVARDLEGELPPLAIARARLQELPLTVLLDDSSSMSPQARISQVDEARLMVRVSESGQATPQPGDLLGTREGVAVGNTDGEPVEVVIDRVVE